MPDDSNVRHVPLVVDGRAGTAHIDDQSGVASFDADSADTVLNRLPYSSAFPTMGQQGLEVIDSSGIISPNDERVSLPIAEPLGADRPLNVYPLDVPGPAFHNRAACDNGRGCHEVDDRDDVSAFQQGTES